MQEASRAGPSPVEVAELFDIADREQAAVAQLQGCVDQLRAACVAKQALGRLSAVQVRAALAYRREVLGEQAW